ncbi:MAG: BREX-1 system adenine-specific DNA-methyltransferase PglX [Acidaminococcaceae bacterium]
MNKTAIKNFAIWARNKLIADITYKAGLLGISEKGIKNPLPQSTSGVQFFDIGTKEPYSISGIEIRQREALAVVIREKEKQSDYSTAYKSVVEEVAYTWFNRLIAVRFMEINDYLPSHVRVLSSESAGKDEPDLVTNPFDTDLEFLPYEKDRIMQLKQDNKLDELFRMLFIKQCNTLNAILPNLFEKTNDYTELLLNVAFTDKDGVVYRLVHDISEDDFNVSKEGQVEIIGWLYQYYISEKHDEVIDILNMRYIKKEDIPAATQLFTPDWVVRYMVDNSLGRYWIERNPKSELREKLDFFVTSKTEDITHIDEKVEPKDLTFFDPCMGSGHILVYAFDVLMEIYRECGYSDRDAAVFILQDNLYGLDIDDRAYQLAYFAVMMKARSYNRRVLTLDVSPNVYAIQESNEISAFAQDGVTIDSKLDAIGEYLIRQYRHAKGIGSLQIVAEKDYCAFEVYLRDCEKVAPIDLFLSTQFSYTANIMHSLVQQAKIMSKKYTVVCTNPPYMNKLESHLKDFVINEFKPYSSDLFSVFMYRNFDYCKPNGYSAFMTPNVWMFIKSFEKLREYIMMNKSIISLIQMAKGAFFKEATVDICSFILFNGRHKNNGFYIRLEDYKGGMEVQKQKALEAIVDKNCGYFYETSAENFSKIPGMPIAYWVSDRILQSYSNTCILDIAKPCKGIDTGDNNTFLRLWFEVSSDKQFIPSGKQVITSDFVNKKWFPYNKGGAFRKWYGNNEYVLNWSNKGNTLRAFSGSNLRNKDYYFEKGITWSTVTSGNLSLRYFDYGFLFDNGGCCLFSEYNLQYIQGLLNSKVTKELMSISPTLNYQPGDIGRVPVIISEELKTQIDQIVLQNIILSKKDWDSFETSWDFIKHPLICGTVDISESFNQWKQLAESQFNQLKTNEEELNRLFIEIYGLQNELTPEFDDKDVTIRKADLGRDIRSFISYAVGCMFGRYSLDIDGLAYAGGHWDDNKYRTFIPDKDNILLITDEGYFEDDILGLFVAFVKKVYGSETLEENLDFIAKALGNRGNTSREIIRNYFVKDFFKDHCKIYQKRPIYWFFDSGKADGFKALIYMHRYDENTIGNLRIDYLHKMQRIYEREIIRMQETIDNSTNAREVAAAEKRKDKLIKQLKETKDYDEKIAHLALARIPIDLDDGVKVNYDKVQTGTDGKKLEVLAKI